MRRLRLGCPPQASDNARRWYGGVIRPFRTLAEKPWAPHHWNLRRWAFNKLFQIISFLLRKEYSYTHECSCEAPYFYTLLSILKYSSICKAIGGRIKDKRIVIQKLSERTHEEPTDKDRTIHERISCGADASPQFAGIKLGK